MFRRGGEDVGGVGCVVSGVLVEGGEGVEWRESVIPSRLFSSPCRDGIIALIRQERSESQRRGTPRFMWLHGSVFTLRVPRPAPECIIQLYFVERGLESLFFSLLFSDETLLFQL